MTLFVVLIGLLLVALGFLLVDFLGAATATFLSIIFQLLVSLHQFAITEVTVFMALKVSLILRLNLLFRLLLLFLLSLSLFAFFLRLFNGSIAWYWVLIVAVGHLI